MAGALAVTTAAAPVKVAVLGDSISTGAHAVDRARNGYPARLGDLLGAGFEVRAFARSSLCLLRRADLPFTKTPEFPAALEWRPDVALIMLGTNDSSEQRGNWRHHADLERDARFLVAVLREANPKVVIHLLGPPPMFPEKKGLKPERAADLKTRAPHLAVIRETCRQIAAAEPGVFWHDLARALHADQTSDGVHPDTFGHEYLAYHLRDLLTTSWDESFDVAARLQETGLAAKASSFHGFRRFDFRLPRQDVACIVVAPHQAAAGHPWIWRARFFGHQPELDLSLLDRGFHVAYCDVAHLYGAPEALRRWDAFYRLATRKLGLARKPVLEGMSRGGLPIFLWGERHPNRVAAIYGDNPVCDFRSWPGGRHGQRSDGDWQRCLAAYGLTEAAAADFPQPLDPDRLQPLAAAHVPVALVLGLADTVVPPAENGDLLAARYRQLGAPLQVWHKPGNGHHPHGLHPPDPLRRFLWSAATGRSFNPAALPEPSSEYRGRSAGWGGGTWWDAFAHLKQVVARHPDAKVVFLGDSITQGLTGHRDRVSHPDGRRVFDQFCGTRKALSLGLSGARTEHILWELDHGLLDGLHPEVIVLLIGVNNLVTAHHTGAEIAGGTAAIVWRLRALRPRARIVLLGCFPSGKAPDDPRRAEIAALHRGIRPLADGRRVLYRDLRPRFLTPDGHLNHGVRGDAIHLNTAGQKIWLEGIQDLLTE